MNPFANFMKKLVLSPFIYILLFILITSSSCFSPQQGKWDNRTGKLTGTRILVYTRNGEGYVHKSIPAGVDAIKKLSGENGFHIDISDDHAAKIAGYFSEVADVVENDADFVKTTGQFRDFNVMAGALHFSGLEITGLYPNLGKSVDSAIMQAIGKENEQMTPEKRHALVSVLEAVAWGVSE